MALAAGLALVLRATVIDGETLDLEFQQRWLDFIRDNGGFHALELDFSSYTPFYSYTLLIGTYLPDAIGDNVILKYATIAADFICAWFVYEIVRRMRGNGLLPVTAFAVVLFTPTVVLNGAHWGQTDMLWTAGIVASLAFLLGGRNAAAMIAFGLAFSIKQQAVFFVPFLLVLALKRVVPWRHFLLVPAVYLVTIVPALLAGRSLWDLVTIYREQSEVTGNSQYLTKNAPNLYQWLSESHAEVLARPTLVWGGSIVLLLTLLVAALPFQLTGTRIIALATASTLLVPFVMPRMHDRYFFAADVLSIVLAFCVPRLFPVALLVQLASVFSYLPFLFDVEPIPLTYVAFANLAAITLLFVWLAREIASDMSAPEAVRT
jgi:Gpi18-like mannosyltransferase